MIRIVAGLLTGILLSLNGGLSADDSTTTPRPIPITRPEMKKILEEMKDRKPRIPLPEITSEEREKLGERGANYEGRLRYHYMPQGDARGGMGGVGQAKEPDPNMSLDYQFKTQLFWIVSRTNNCQYCLGHQEVKLATSGMTEEAIAALDGDWSEATPAQRAAYAFARKYTYQPHLLNDADIEGLRKHYKDLQILEMILSMAGNNSINRWKEGVGVPQSRDLSNFGKGKEKDPDPKRILPIKTFETPTPEKFKDLVTKVAPIEGNIKSEGLRKPTLCERPKLESRAEVEKALESAANRKPRLPLVEEEKAREIIGKDLPEGPLPQWARLLANFPKDGKNRIVGIKAADDKGDLKPLVKAQVSWIIARQDRAWYATGEAKNRLKALGWSDDQIFKLDGNWADFSEIEKALFTVARKLAASPVVLTDDDVARAVKLAGPRDVVQLISYVTNRASFDRITESAGLTVEK